MFSENEVQELRGYIERVSELNEEFNEIVKEDKEMIGRLLLKYPIEVSLSEYAEKNNESLRTMRPDVMETAIQYGEESLKKMTGKKEYERVVKNVEEQVEGIKALLEYIKELKDRYKVIEM